MNQSTTKPINLSELLRHFRQKHRLSINKLSKLSGISRRTLTRIEAGFYKPSPRVGMKLARILQPDQPGQDSTSILEQVLDPYPAFLFHDFRALSERSRSVAKTPRFLRGGDPERSRGTADPFAEFAPDYSGVFFRLILMPERNLAQRLRAFRLQHGLTLKDTAYLLDLSLSHLHALESGQRSPSPRTRFRILRLLTLPFPNRDSLEEVLGLPRQRRGTRSDRQQHLDALKALLSIPPPEPIELTDDSDRLRYLWLTSTDSTRHLAAQLQISQPHLIRLLRGDRRPSRSLRQRLELQTASPRLSRVPPRGLS